MSLLASAAVAWVALAVPFGLVLGRGMRIADHRQAASWTDEAMPDFIPSHVVAAVATATSPGA